ncbi:MAG: DUF1460 domain-containing protein [Methylococcales bacterium]|nr:DUF1460 domain-containing protein [Methylococcales bacterium]
MNSFSPFIKTIQLLGLSSLLLGAFNLNASNLSKAPHDPIIEKLYHTLNNNSKSDMAKRLEIASSLFLEKPYVLWALGEGPEARFDQSPLYRTDGFDCETYVDTVLAIALAENPHIFKQCINKIRYLNGRVDFLTRNHFISLDWNINNQRAGFIKDITTTIKGKNNQPVAKMASALIDKPSWYQSMKTDRINVSTLTKEEQVIRLLELRKQGRSLSKKVAKIPYLPLTALFDKQGKPDKALFAQIPNAAIIEIVRPDWDLRQQIGTHLNVSHLGFAFWKNGEIVFRQASSNVGKVVEVPLVDYLKATLASPTIKGINIQVLMPEKPLSTNCNPKLMQ